MICCPDVSARLLLWCLNRVMDDLGPPPIPLAIRDFIFPAPFLSTYLCNLLVLVDIVSKTNGCLTYKNKVLFSKSGN
jgi:hypothetical protein